MQCGGSRTLKKNAATTEGHADARGPVWCVDMVTIVDMKEQGVRK